MLQNLVSYVSYLEMSQLEMSPVKRTSVLTYVYFLFIAPFRKHGKSVDVLLLDLSLKLSVPKVSSDCLRYVLKEKKRKCQGKNEFFFFRTSPNHYI